MTVCWIRLKLFFKQIVITCVTVEMLLYSKVNKNTCTAHKKSTKVVLFVKVKQASCWQLWRFSAQHLYVYLVKLLGNNSGIFQYIELAEFPVHSRGINYLFQIIGELFKN